MSSDTAVVFPKFVGSARGQTLIMVLPWVQGFLKQMATWSIASHATLSLTKNWLTITFGRNAPRFWDSCWWTSRNDNDGRGFLWWHCNEATPTNVRCKDCSEKSMPTAAVGDIDIIPEADDLNVGAQDQLPQGDTVSSSRVENQKKKQMVPLQVSETKTRLLIHERMQLHSQVLWSVITATMKLLKACTMVPWRRQFCYWLL